MLEDDDDTWQLLLCWLHIWLASSDKLGNSTPFTGWYSAKCRNNSSRFIRWQPWEWLHPWTSSSQVLSEVQHLQHLQPEREREREKAESGNYSWRILSEDSLQPLSPGAVCLSESFLSFSLSFLHSSHFHLHWYVSMSWVNSCSLTAHTLCQAWCNPHN